jgi:hypothetical protein
VTGKGRFGSAIRVRIYHIRQGGFSTLSWVTTDASVGQPTEVLVRPTEVLVRFSYLQLMGIGSIMYDTAASARSRGFIPTEVSTSRSAELANLQLMGLEILRHV